MSAGGSAGSAGSAGSTHRASGAARAATYAETSRPLHPRSFKLRFAPQREPGRSYVSPVKPFALPATVTDKFYGRAEQAGAEGAVGAGEEAQLEARALRRMQDMLTCGPRERHAAPLTSAHEYGWWWENIKTLEQVPHSDRRLHHHIQDSQWLKECLRVLAADDKLKQK